MENNNNYFLVGMFVLLGLLGLGGFVVWMHSANGQRDYTFYQIKFHESVNGLSNGSPVKFRGVDIGSVVAIKIDLAESNTIITQIRVTEGSPVKRDTVAMLKLQGITGTSYIELSGGDAAQPDMEGSASGKGDLPDIPSKFSDIATLSNKVPELIDKTSDIATQAKNLLDDQALANTHEILERWKNISAILEQEATQLDSLLKTTEHLVQTTDGVMMKVSNSDIEGTFRDLRQTTAALRSLATTTSASTTSSLDQFNALLIDARKTSQEFRNLTRSLNENPSQIIYPAQQKEERLP